MDRDTQRFNDLASALSVHYLGNEGQKRIFQLPSQTQIEVLSHTLHFSLSGLADDLKKIDKSLDGFKTRPVAPLVVIGKAGSNKSALLAHWLRATKIIPQGSLVFYHSAVFSSASADPTRALRRLLSQLQTSLGWVRKRNYAQNFENFAADWLTHFGLCVCLCVIYRDLQSCQQTWPMSRRCCRSCCSTFPVRFSSFFVSDFFFVAHDVCVQLTSRW